ncbi:hypothetical protein DBR06_SOUSAS210008, partial [Sousa chinensis]
VTKAFSRDAEKKPLTPLPHPGRPAATA